MLGEGSMSAVLEYEEPVKTLPKSVELESEELVKSFPKSVELESEELVKSFPKSVELEYEELVKSFPKSLGSIPESDWFGRSPKSMAPGIGFVALAKISESVNGVELFESGALEEVPKSVSLFTCFEKKRKRKTPYDFNHSSNLYLLDSNIKNIPLK